MKLLLPLTATLAIALALGLRAAPDESSRAMLAHMVFFELKQPTAQAKEKLVAACKKHLSKHEGTAYFSVGTLAEEFNREVNDRGFHVALHMVFKDKAAHDRYQTHERHVKFVNENKDDWKKVRVFDSYLEKSDQDAQVR